MRSSLSFYLSGNMSTLSLFLKGILFWEWNYRLTFFLLNCKMSHHCSLFSISDSKSSCICMLVPLYVLTFLWLFLRFSLSSLIFSSLGLVLDYHLGFSDLLEYINRYLSPNLGFFDHYFLKIFLSLFSLLNSD